jgi:hypothetical protein
MEIGDGELEGIFFYKNAIFKRMHFFLKIIFLKIFLLLHCFQEVVLFHTINCGAPPSHGEFHHQQ